MVDRLPYSRTVKVNMSRNDRFPTQAGFGTGLILTNVEVAGEVDATHLTKIYANMDEITADHAAGTNVYEQANVIFAQNPAPTRIKVGYVDVTAATTTAAQFKTELDALYDADQDFYAILIDKAIRDDDMLDGLVEWVEAKSKIAMIDSNDALLKDDTDDTNIAARHKGTVERTAVFYHDDASEYLAAAAWAYMATRNFDQAESAYTLKFKPAKLVQAVNVGTDAVTAITGFVEGIGQSETAGHCANTLIDIGNQNFIVEGSVLKQNVFLDEIHATDYIIARTEEKTLALFLNNAAIGFDDSGMQQIASVPRAVMAQGVRSKIVAKDLNPLTGEYEPAFVVTVPSVFDIPESQRKARVSPVISVRFRYRGAVHYTTINYQMTF
jgi:hypothetical protein